MVSQVPVSLEQGVAGKQDVERCVVVIALSQHLLCLRVLLQLLANGSAGRTVVEHHLRGRVGGRRKGMNALG